MAVIQSDIIGVELFDSPAGPRHTARIRLENAIVYAASADTLQIGGGGKLFGVTNSLDLEDIIENIRRDGKTVNLIDGMAGAAGYTAAGVAVYVDTVAVSGNNLTGEFADAASTEVDVAAGGLAVPCEVWVTYDLS